MLQLICNTSGTLKSAQTLCWSASLYSNRHFFVVTFLHGNDSDCGFTTTHCSMFYKVTGLIMGENCFRLFLDDKIMIVNRLK